MGHTVVHKPESPHECDLPDLSRHWFEDGTIVRCDECGTYYRHRTDDGYGVTVYWARCVFQRIVARKYAEATRQAAQ